jgi:hypothetical protein
MKIRRDSTESRQFCIDTQRPRKRHAGSCRLRAKGHRGYLAFQGVGQTGGLKRGG